MDQRQFFIIISMIALGTAVFSPLLPVTHLILPVVLPEIFWVSTRVLIFVSTLYAAIGMLVISAVPAAVFERVARRPRGDDVTMLVWTVSAAVLSLLVWQVLG